MRRLHLVMCNRFVCAAVLWSVACTGELEPEPGCFLDGSTLALEARVLSLNLCCEPGEAGDQSCQSALEALSSPVAPLAVCSEQGRCEVCEVGVSCGCLEHLDCESGERCEVVSDATRCAESLEAPPLLKRCALCLTH